MAAASKGTLRTLNVGGRPYDVSSDGTHAWVSNYDAGTVQELELSTGVVLRSIHVGSFPSGVSADGTHVWVTKSQTGTVSEFGYAAECSSGANTGTITLSPGLTNTPAVQTAKIKGTLAVSVLPGGNRSRP